MEAHSSRMLKDIPRPPPGCRELDKNLLEFNKPAFKIRNQSD